MDSKGTADKDKKAKAAGAKRGAKPPPGPHTHNLRSGTGTSPGAARTPPPPGPPPVGRGRTPTPTRGTTTPGRAVPPPTVTTAPPSTATATPTTSTPSGGATSRRAAPPPPFGTMDDGNPRHTVPKVIASPPASLTLSPVSPTTINAKLATPMLSDREKERLRYLQPCTQRIKIAKFELDKEIKNLTFTLTILGRVELSQTIIDDLINHKKKIQTCMGNVQEAYKNIMLADVPENMDDYEFRLEKALVKGRNELASLIRTIVTAELDLIEIEHKRFQKRKEEEIEAEERIATARSARSKAKTKRGDGGSSPSGSSSSSSDSDDDHRRRRPRAADTRPHKPNEALKPFKHAC